jgi:hypothetical protein
VGTTRIAPLVDRPILRVVRQVPRRQELLGYVLNYVPILGRLSALSRQVSAPADKVNQSEPVNASEICRSNRGSRVRRAEGACLRMGVHARLTKWQLACRPSNTRLSMCARRAALVGQLFSRSIPERGAIVAPNGAAASAGCSPEAGSLPRVKAAPAERPSSEGWIEHHRVRSALLSEVVSANRASRVQWRPLTDPEHRYGSNSKLSSARNRSKRRQRASSGKERQPTQVVGHALGVTDILGPEIFGGEDGTTFATSSPFHPSR